MLHPGSAWRPLGLLPSPCPQSSQLVHQGPLGAVPRVGESKTQPDESAPPSTVRLGALGKVPGACPPAPASPLRGSRTIKHLRIPQQAGLAWQGNIFRRKKSHHALHATNGPRRQASSLMCHLPWLCWVPDTPSPLDRENAQVASLTSLPDTHRSPASLFTGHCPFQEAKQPAKTSPWHLSTTFPIETQDCLPTRRCQGHLGLEICQVSPAKRAGE